MELVKRSSSIGKMLVYMAFKIKYAHSVFIYAEVREECEALFWQIAEEQQIRIDEIGFDENHIHIDLDLGLKSIPEVAKLLKGTTGRKLLKKFPWIKRRYFWGSGFWSPVVYFDSIGRDLEQIRSYVKTQKFGSMKNQTKLNGFISNMPLV